MDKQKKCALYIHIPFCVKKCAYCDFASYEDYSFQEAYFDALKKEIILAADKWKGRVFDTLFIGGGTPTSVKNEHIEQILDMSHRSLNLKLKEATVEANPGTVDMHKLQFYLYSGLNRISFGMQAAQDHLLKAVGRIHDFNEAKESVALAQRSGFSNINVDLMSGLPGQSVADLLESVKRTADMGVLHVSMYTLNLEEGTPLWDAVQKGSVILPSKDEEHEMSKAARVRLSELGYNRYEISNYAKPEHECRHNLHYWHNDDYLGLGLAAASSMSGLRTNNTRDIGEYIRKACGGQMPYDESSKSGEEEYAFETLMLGLRLVQGVDVAGYKERHKIDLIQRFGKEIDSLKERGLADVYEGRLYLTEHGMDIQNTVLVEFMEGFDF